MMKVIVVVGVVVKNGRRYCCEHRAYSNRRTLGKSLQKNCEKWDNHIHYFESGKKHICYLEIGEQAFTVKGCHIGK